MALSVGEKQAVLKAHGLHEKDCGSSAVQIALLSESIAKLTAHLKKFQKDIHSRRGLMGQVQRRQKLLKYLKRVNLAGYRRLIRALHLRDVV